MYKENLKLPEIRSTKISHQLSSFIKGNRWVRVVLAVLIPILIVVFGVLQLVQARTFIFLQTSWGGGANPTAYNTATGDKADPGGWDKYSSQTGFDDSSGTSLVFDTTTTTLTDSTDTDFDEGKYFQTVLKGSGEDAQILLQNQNPQDLNTWSEPPLPIVSVGSSASMVAVGSDLYVLFGEGKSDFYKYTPSTQTWLQLPDTPSELRSGSTMTYDAVNNDIYAMRGDGKAFWKFSIIDNQWSILPKSSEPPWGVSEGATMVAPGEGDYADYIYLLHGNSTYYSRYSISSGTWSSKQIIKNQFGEEKIAGRGAKIAYPGTGDYLYAMLGGNTDTFWRYSMKDDRWNSTSDGAIPETAPEVAFDGSALIQSSDSNIMYYIPGDSGLDGTTNLYSYDITANTWSASLGQMPTNLFNGAGGVFFDDGIYALVDAGPDKGSATTNFWHYFIASGEWSSISFLAGDKLVDLGGALVNDNNGMIYALRGGRSRDFFRFDVDADGGRGAWTQLADTPAEVSQGADLIYNSALDSGGIYAIQGNTTSGNSGFWRYDIATNAWQTSGYPSPGDVGHGGSLTLDASGNMYILLGGGSTSFKKCQLVPNPPNPPTPCAGWVTLAQISGAVDRGGDLAYPGNGSYVYAFQGNLASKLYRYDINANAWSQIASTPDNTQVGEGAVLMYPGIDQYLYAFAGNNSNKFWRYDIQLGSWDVLTNAPGALSSGSDITFTGDDGLYLYAFQGGGRNTFWRYAFRANYFPSGTFESEIFDTTENTHYANIDWSEVVSLYTDVNLKLRSSNDPTMNDADDWSTCTTITNGGNIGNGGYGCVTDTDRYLQYQVTLTTTNGYYTPRFLSLDATYEHYYLNSELISSPFNSEDPTNVVSGIVWEENETLPPNTNIQFQIRTAPDNGGVPGTWSDFLGPTSSSDFFDDTAPDCSKVGVRVTCIGMHPDLLDATDDQWFQYRLIGTSGGGFTPELTELQLQYVINTAPEVTISNTPTQSTQGVVEIVYNVTDEEESSVDVYLFADVGVSLDEAIPDSVSTSDIVLAGGGVSQFPTGGVILVDNEMISYTGISGSMLTGVTRKANQTRATLHPKGTGVYLQLTGGVGAEDMVGTTSVGSGYSITWNVRDDLISFYKSDAKVKVVAVDGNAANQVGFAEKPLILDTKAPTTPQISIDSRLDTLSLNASDNSSIQMKISNKSDLSYDGFNSISGQWVGYNTSKNWTLDATADGIETVYVRFKDIYGNETSVISASTPAVPEDLVVTDISHVYGSDYKVFISWKRIDEPTPGFAAYDVYMSTEGDDPKTDTYTFEASITDIAENYYVDNNLDITKTYYYRVVARDSAGNISNYNVNYGRQQGDRIDWGEGITPGVGGGGDAVILPVITDVEVGGIDEDSAVITWRTDKLTNAIVGYSTTPGVYTTQVGVATMEYTHSVTLNNLASGQLYYFKVMSFDAMDNKGESINDNVQKFTTGADSIAPTIANVTAIPGVTTAGVTWSTDEAANSRVEYGLTDSYGETTIVTEDFVVGHAVTLTDLDAESEYHYRVISQDPSGNEAVSGDGTFTTLAGKTGDGGGEPTPPTDVTAPTISDISFSDVTATSITVSFKTNEPARGVIEYGTTTNYDRGDTSGNLEELATQHSIVLKNLIPATSYHFKIFVFDVAGNLGQNSDATFITNPEEPEPEITPEGDSGGETPPVLSAAGPLVTNITSSGAVVSWATSDASTSIVIYRVSGTDDDPLIAGTGATYTKDHQVKLSGLVANTEYEFQVKSQDTENNYITSKLYTFKTDSLPGLSNVRVANLTFNSASIVWETSIPTNSVVEYGSQSGVYDHVLSNAVLGTTHQIDLVGLAMGGTYYFVVKGQSDVGERLSSDEYTFTSRSTPSVLDLSISNITPTSVSLLFETNIVSSVGVDYTNTKSNAVGSKYGEGFGNRHTIDLTGLSPNTFYTFVVSMTDQSGEEYLSDQYSFQTADDEIGPDISLIETHSNLTDDEHAVQALISWTTDEDATSRVKYTKSIGGETYEFDTTAGRDFGQSHIVVLNDLEPSTAYQFVVISADASGNETESLPNVMLTPGKKASIFELIFGSLEETFSWLKDLK